MANTQIADIIIPEIFNPYVIERTAELDRFLQSGIATPLGQDDIIMEMKAKGKRGGFINMPFWKDLTGDDEVLSDTVALTPGKIETGQDIAIMMMRGRAWQVNDLSEALAGDDPMKAIATLVAQYWARRHEVSLINVLTGAFGAASMSGNVSDITSETGTASQFNSTTALDATGKLGDTQDDLAGLAVHGNTLTSMKKQDLIDFVEDSKQGKPIPMYHGKRVIVDDTLPTDGTDYTSYFFGNGAVAYESVVPMFANEADRIVLSGNSVLATRSHFLQHPRGIKYIGAVSATTKSPTNAELATGTNWSKVYENKNIRIVQFKHKLL
jgi:hypothetical protein